jgi:hypothetical protein
VTKQIIWIVLVLQVFEALDVFAEDVVCRDVGGWGRRRLECGDQ